MNQPTPATDPMPSWPAIVLDVERARDQADDDTGPYYAIAKRSGTLVTRGGRPLTATLTEWSEFRDALPTTAYIPVGAHPLFGSLPLHDTGNVPDLVGRLVNAVGFLEAGATMLVTRAQHLDKAIAAHLPDPTADAAQQREERAEAEARPHDGEQHAGLDDRPSSVPHSAEQVLGAKRAVIGWVWPDPVSPELYWCALHAANSTHVQSVPKQHHLSARDRAIAWVLGKNGNQLMAEEAGRG